MTIKVVREDGTIEAINIAGAILAREGARLSRLVVIGRDESADIEHFFTPDGYYDGWGARGWGARCDGRYPTPGPRSEPFDVTYRCGKQGGHKGPCGPS